MTQTLTQLCYHRVALLMKDSYWSRSRPFQHDSPPVLSSLFSYNPFACLPTTIVDKLITYFSRITEIEGPDWQLLLTSGRVRNFTIIASTWDYESPLFTKDIKPENLSKTFLDLSFSSLNLTAIKIKQLGQASQSVTEGLDLLLLHSPNLKKVESDAKFHFRALSNCFQLEELVVNFVVDDDNHIHDFFYINGEFRNHSSLKRLVLQEDLVCKYGSYTNQMRSKDAVVDIMSVLDYCKELICLDCDISRSLEYFHLHELQSGSLTKRFKLQRCFFKYDYYAPVSREAVEIASVTCPDLREVFVWTNEYGISSLSNFKNLRHLELHWQPIRSETFAELFAELMTNLRDIGSLVGPPLPGDYALTVKPLLEQPEFGYKLLSLHLLSFTNIDFSSIGCSCPNLEELSVFYDEGNNRSQFLSTSFRKLLRLKLIKDSMDVEADSLVGILSHAVNLEVLHVEDAGEFTDVILSDILKANSFPKLEDIEIYKCSLSLSGITSLASTVRSLKTFTYMDNAVKKPVVEAIFKEYNSTIIVKNNNELRDHLMHRFPVKEY